MLVKSLVMKAICNKMQATQWADLHSLQLAGARFYMAPKVAGLGGLIARAGMDESSHYVLDFYDLNGHYYNICILFTQDHDMDLAEDIDWSYIKLLFNNYSITKDAFVADITKYY